MIHASLQLPVDFSPMPDPYDENEKAFIFNTVDDPVGANSDAKVVLSTFEANCSIRTRISGKGTQRLVNSL